MNKSNIDGYVHSIDTYSTLDGFGIRSVVFMQGCNLRCAYCHNPDTWVKQNGTKMTVKDIYSKLKNYVTYYGNKGGVTFGGGEPLLQPEFVLACVEEFNKIGVKSCIETSGNVELTETVKKLAYELDYVICDLKFPNTEMYKEYAGVTMDRTLEFLRFLNNNKIPTWVRTVIVPNINDSNEILEEYRQVLSEFTNIFRWELLPFSKLGFEKYKELKIPNRLEYSPDLDMVKFNKLQKKFEFNKR